MADEPTTQVKPEFAHYEAHPLLLMWPDAAEPDLTMMEADIQRQGVRQDIVIWKDRKGKPWLIDGRTRQTAARRAFNKKVEAGEKPESDNGLPLQPGVFEFTGSQDDIYNFIKTANTRKHYMPGQKAAIGVRLYYHDYKQKHGDTLPTPAEEVQGGGDTSEAMGERFGCSGYYVRICRQLYREAPDLLDAVAAGIIPPPKAARELKRRRGGEGAAAPEPPGDPEKVTDAAGKEVPEVAVEKFRARGGFRVVKNHLNDALRAAAKLATVPGGENLNLANFEQAVEAMLRSLTAAAPHEVCDKCNGKGLVRGAGCKPCGGYGYKTKAILSAEKKAAKAGATGPDTKPDAKPSTRPGKADGKAEEKAPEPAAAG